MINRWQGNSGRVQRLPEREDSLHPQPRTASPPPQPGRVQSAPPHYARQSGAGGGLFSALEGLKRLLPVKTEELETEDIILLLILYLMYRESGDSELLMIMGAMFLL